MSPALLAPPTWHEIPGISCPRVIPFLHSQPWHGAPLAESGNGHRDPSSGGGGGGGGDAGRNESGFNDDSPLALWAVADTFTLLAAAARAAEGVAGTTGLPEQPKARHAAPNGLSDIIVSLPCQTLGLSRGGSETAALAARIWADGDDEEERGVSAGRGAGGSAGCSGGDAKGPQPKCPLLSASSALVFVKEFLAWAARERCGSPPQLVADGWDAGIGVWLGLTHCVRALARVLELGSGGGRRKGTATALDNDHGPVAESIALAVFELRAVVGTPSAALCVLDPLSAASEAYALASENPCGALSSSTSAGDGPVAEKSTGAALDGVDSCTPSILSRRPPPGTMVAGFLRRMSERWKANLDWGLPGSAPPRRASPRLDHGNHHHRRGGRWYGEYSATESLRAEGEDLFFALRAELLRAERLALSMLLVGPRSTLAGRTWAMRAALASARRRGQRTAEGDGRKRPRPPSSIATVSPSRRFLNASGASKAHTHLFPVVAEEDPEAGWGPARDAMSTCCSGGVTKSVRQRGTFPTGCKGGGGGGAGKETPGRRWSRAREEDEEEKGSLSIGVMRRELVGVAKVAGDGYDEGDESDGLGRLCRLAAVEMREGLESGLSIKLTQVIFVRCRYDSQRALCFHEGEMAF